MSLLTQIETTSAQIASDADNLAAHLQAAISITNQMSSKVLGLPTDNLNEWLNSRPFDQRLNEFAAHLDVGNKLNEVAIIAEMITGKSLGLLGRVDVRSIAEKLAIRGKLLEIKDELFSVTDIPIPESDTVVESEEDYVADITDV